MACIILHVDVPPSIPFRAAQAYGAPPATNTPASRKADPAAPIAHRPIVDRLELESVPSSRLNSLVAGTVRSDINHGHGFDGDAATPPRNGPIGKIDDDGLNAAAVGNYPLYTRKAEHVEAAMRVQLGSTIDLKG